jgi:acetylornithine deacetylase/succinyl-diaminopimelate desuccinylase-like protein
MSPLQYAQNQAETFVVQLEDWLRIPSISTDSAFDADVRKAADWLAADFKKMGMKTVEIMETGGHPIVYAAHHVSDDLPTVLIYGHYDVQPPEPLELWESPPFEPIRKDGNIVARGSCDDKGQVFMHVKALEAYLKTNGTLPVNVKCLIEGEEESGSVHLYPFIEKHKELLKADVVLVSDTAMFDDGVPSIVYGLRGLAYVQVELEGPSKDLHSGIYGGAVENPLNHLCKMIGKLHDAFHRVAVPGFYDHVLPLTKEQREGYKALPFDEAAWKAEIGITNTKTEAGYGILEATSARPTLDVNGIWGGYQGEGAKTVLPSKAGAKISCRLVPHQTPEDITAKLKTWFERNTPPTMKLTFTDLHGGYGAIVDTNHPAMQAASEAMEQVFGKKPLFTREGGSIPVVAEFKRILGLDTVLMGLGLNSDSIHSPNEKFAISRFNQGIACSILFMEKLK